MESEIHSLVTGTSYRKIWDAESMHLLCIIFLNIKWANTFSLGNAIRKIKLEQLCLGKDIYEIRLRERFFIKRNIYYLSLKTGKLYCDFSEKWIWSKYIFNTLTVKANRKLPVPEISLSQSCIVLCIFVNILKNIFICEKIF